MILTYVGIPYSGTPEQINDRIEMFLAVDAWLIKQGKFTVSPISKHFCFKHGVPDDWKFWKEYGLSLLSKCDELYVIDVDGWRSSKGLTDEIQAAKWLSLPVIYHSTVMTA